jgi:hypothetical protein
MGPNWREEITSMTEGQAMLVNCAACQLECTLGLADTGPRIWQLQTEISQRPYGRAGRPLMTVPASTYYILCGPCSQLLATGQTAALARILAANGWLATPERMYDQMIKETALWLSKLAEHAAPMSVVEWIAEWTAANERGES